MTAAAKTLFDCAMSLRRLAHDYKKDALMWASMGKLEYYADCRNKSDRLWRDAKWYLEHARMLNNA